MATQQQSGTDVSTGSAGSKGKGKFKGRTIDLQDFLQDVPRVDWAKAMEQEAQQPFNNPESTTTTIQVKTHIIQTRSQLPVAPKAARSAPVVDESRVPAAPPFVARVSNVAFTADHNALARWLIDNQPDLKWRNINLVRDEAKNQIKGFGFIELEDRKSLVLTLELAGEKFMGRELRIEVNEENPNRPQYQQRNQQRNYDPDFRRPPLPPFNRPPPYPPQHYTDYGPPPPHYGAEQPPGGYNTLPRQRAPATRAQQGGYDPEDYNRGAPPFPMQRSPSYHYDGREQGAYPPPQHRGAAAYGGRYPEHRYAPPQQFYPPPNGTDLNPDQ